MAAAAAWHERELLTDQSRVCTGTRTRPDALVPGRGVISQLPKSNFQEDAVEEWPRLQLSLMPANMTTLLRASTIRIRVLLPINASERLAAAGLAQWLNVSWNRSAVNSSDTGAACGNGFREEGEGCDDANVAAGDGCAPDCTVLVPEPDSRYPKPETRNLIPENREQVEEEYSCAGATETRGPDRCGPEARAARGGVTDGTVPTLAAPPAWVLSPTLYVYYYYIYYYIYIYIYIYKNIYIYIYMVTEGTPPTLAAPPAWVLLPTL